MWAHSVNQAGVRHALADHLRSTGALARAFASPFGAGDLAEALGLLHDAGKADCGWQQRLLEVEGRNLSVGLDHKTLGARMAAPIAGPAALAILGHHGGLTARTDLLSVARNGARSGATAIERDLLTTVPEIRGLLAGGSVLPSTWSTPLALEMGLRLTFSALVDADHLDTAAHFAGLSAPEIAAPADMRQLVKRFEAARAEMLRDRAPTSVNELRDELYRMAVAAAAGRPNLYRLPAPTGSGKTMTAAAFALHHAAANEQARVIVAVPFITITEQNAQVYRELLGDDAVLEHHSATDSDARRAKLGAENWDAPFVVTTTLQLFDSLFGRKPSRSRKLHRLANAVIVLDEVQSLPIPLLVPILDGLRVLVKYFGSTVLLASATQPAFEHLQVWRQHDVDVVDIVQNRETVYARLRRARYEWWLDPPPTDAEVADRVSPEGQALVVVNTTQAAREMFTLLMARTVTPVRHLSTRMCPAHRKAVLDEVRGLLAANQPVILVSTQLIEAGVDVDFPVVYRALAPADSLQQAAGRANREGRRPEPGRVIVFASTHTVPDYRTPIAQTALYFGPGKADPDDLDALRRYYEGLYNALNTDNGKRATCIQDNRKKLDFIAVAEGPLVDAAGAQRNSRLAFHMLDDDTVPVVVTTYDNRASDLLDELRRGESPRRATFRALQRYIVALRRDIVDRPEIRALCTPVIAGNELREWRGSYHEHYGIDEGATGKDSIW